MIVSVQCAKKLEQNNVQRRYQLGEMAVFVDLAKIPGHVGIIGNEIAGQKGKNVHIKYT